jgi:hypothetical protein
MLNGMDDSTNDFLDEPVTVIEPYETIASCNQRWRLELATRPTVNLRPCLAADAQAVTTRMEVVRP